MIFFKNSNGMKFLGMVIFFLTFFSLFFGTNATDDCRFHVPFTVVAPAPHTILQTSTDVCTKMVLLNYEQVGTTLPRLQNIWFKIMYSSPSLPGSPFTVNFTFNIKRIGPLPDDGTLIPIDVNSALTWSDGSQNPTFSMVSLFLTGTEEYDPNNQFGLYFGAPGDLRDTNFRFSIGPLSSAAPTPFNPNSQYWNTLCTSSNSANPNFGPACQFQASIGTESLVVSSAITSPHIQNVSFVLSNELIDQSLSHEPVPFAGMRAVSTHGFILDIVIQTYYYDPQSNKITGTFDIHISSSSSTAVPAMPPEITFSLEIYDVYHNIYRLDQIYSLPISNSFNPSNISSSWALTSEVCTDVNNVNIGTVGNDCHSTIFFDYDRSLSTSPFPYPQANTLQVTSVVAFSPYQASSIIYPNPFSSSQSTFQLNTALPLTTTLTYVSQFFLTAQLVFSPPTSTPSIVVFRYKQTVQIGSITETFHKLSLLDSVVSYSPVSNPPNIQPRLIYSISALSTIPIQLPRFIHMWPGQVFTSTSFSQYSGLILQLTDLNSSSKAIQLISTTTPSTAYNLQYGIVSKNIPPGIYRVSMFTGAMTVAVPTSFIAFVHECPQDNTYGIHCSQTLSITPFSSNRFIYPYTQSTPPTTVFNTNFLSFSIAGVTTALVANNSIPEPLELKKCAYSWYSQNAQQVQSISIDTSSLTFDNSFYNGAHQQQDLDPLFTPSNANSIFSSYTQPPISQARFILQGRGLIRFYDNFILNKYRCSQTMQYQSLIGVQSLITSFCTCQAPNSPILVGTSCTGEFYSTTPSQDSPPRLEGLTQSMSLSVGPEFYDVSNTFRFQLPSNILSVDLFAVSAIYKGESGINIVDTAQIVIILHLGSLTRTNGDEPFSLDMDSAVSQKFYRTLIEPNVSHMGSTKISKNLAIFLSIADDTVADGTTLSTPLYFTDLKLQIIGDPASGHKCQDDVTCRSGTYYCSKDSNLIGSAGCSIVGSQTAPDSLTSYYKWQASSPQAVTFQSKTQKGTFLLNEVISFVLTVLLSDPDADAIKKEYYDNMMTTRQRFSFVNANDPQSTSVSPTMVSTSLNQDNASFLTIIYQFSLPSETFAIPSQNDAEFLVYVADNNDRFYSTNQKFTLYSSPNSISVIPGSSKTQFTIQLHCLQCDVTTTTLSAQQYSDFHIDQLYFQLNLYILSNDETTSTFSRILPVRLPDNFYNFNIDKVYHFPWYTKSVNVDLASFKIVEGQKLQFQLVPVFLPNAPADLISSFTISSSIISASPSISLICTSSDRGTYDRDAGQCVCNAGYTGDECQNTSTEICSLTCPSPMVPDSSCQQCICATLHCKFNTKTILVKAKILVSSSLITHPMSSSFSPYSILTHFLPQQLSILTGINRLYPFDSNDPHYSDVFAKPFSTTELKCASFPYLESHSSLPYPQGIEDIFVQPLTPISIQTPDSWLGGPDFEILLAITITNKPFTHLSLSDQADVTQRRLSSLSTVIESVITSQSQFSFTQSLIPSNIFVFNSDQIPGYNIMQYNPTEATENPYHSDTAQILVSVSDSISIQDSVARNVPSVTLSCKAPNTTDPLLFFPCPTLTNTKSNLSNCNQSSSGDGLILDSQCFLGASPFSSLSIFNAASSSLFDSVCDKLFPLRKLHCNERSIPTPSQLKSYAFTSISVGVSGNNNSLTPVDVGSPFSVHWNLSGFTTTNIPIASIGVYITIDGKTTLLNTFVVTGPTQSAYVAIPLAMYNSSSRTGTISIKLIQDTSIAATSQTQIQISTMLINLHTCVAGSQLSYNPTTGDCTCPQGLVLEEIVMNTSTNDIALLLSKEIVDPSTSKCVLPCMKFNTIESASTINSCVCTDHFAGALCATLKQCNGSTNPLFGVIDPVSSSCSNRGTDSTETCDALTQNNICSCFNSFDSADNCKTCKVISTGAAASIMNPTAVFGSPALNCNQYGTNRTRTDILCDKCICKPNFHTTTCSFYSLLASLDFITARTPDTIPKVENSSTLAQTTIDALIRDLALSLSVPVSIIKLESSRYVVDSSDASRIIRRVTFSLGSSTLATAPVQPLSTTSLSQISSLELDVDVDQTVDQTYAEEFTYFSSHSPHFDFLGVSDKDTTSADAPTITNLYDIWDDFQNRFKDSPVANNPDVSDQIGALETTPPPAYDGNCDSSNASNKCPTGEDPYAWLFEENAEPDQSSAKNTTTAVIIIAVVVPVSVLIIVALLVGLYCCKSKQTLCFAPKKKQDDQHLELGTTSNSLTASAGTSRTKSDTTGAGRSTFVTESGAVDLTEVELDSTEPALPPGWKKMQHKVTGHTLYVNQSSMQSQKLSPSAKADEGYEKAW